MKKVIFLQKKLLMVVLLLAVSGGLSYASTPFVTVWNTLNTRSSLNAGGGGSLSGASQVRVPIYATVAGVTFSGSYKMVGADESTRVAITNQAVPVEGTISNGCQIDFGASGTYELVISSVSGGSLLFQFNGGAAASRGDRNRLVNITQWGDVITFNQTQSFRNCASLDITATDTPILSGSMASMFQGCTALVGTSKFSDWNVANVTSFMNFFLNAQVNQSLASWNLNGITDPTTDLKGIIQNTQMDCSNFSSTINGWANNVNKTGCDLGSLPTTLQYYNNQADYDKLFKPDNGGKDWTYSTEGTGTELSFSATCSAPLPVTFAGLQASINSGELLVKWKTISEQNNDKFIVYVSKDGKSWSNIGTVNSKAVNGNSNEVINYEYILKIDTVQKAGISLAIILLSVVLLFSRRKRLFAPLALIIAVFFVSCEKNEPVLAESGITLNEINGGGIYLKITQIDKDGKTTSDSNIIYIK